MNLLRRKAKEKRKFLSAKLEIRSFADIENYIQELISTPITSSDDLRIWLARRSELDSVIEEDKAWLYIQQSCHTNNKEYAESFANFIQEIDQQYAVVSDQLNNKLNDYCSSNNHPHEYEIFLYNEWS